MGTSATLAAFAADRSIPVLLIQADLPGGALNLMVGTGAIAWDDVVFSDTDDRFGAIAAVDALEDGDSDEATPWGFTMLPPSDAAAAALCSPSNQYAPVSIWLGAISPVTGLLLPDPEQLAEFQWDVATLAPDAGSREVDVQCVAADSLLLQDDEGARLTDAFHQSIYPGETGCANVTGLTETRYWGMATPRAGGTVVTPSYNGYEQQP